MRGAMVLLLTVLPCSAMAEDWQKLSGAEIGFALTARTLGYPDGTIQDFTKGGTTVSGNQSGRWSVEGDRYCSVWPPNEIWACYSVEREARGLDIRFTDDEGHATVGRYIDLQ